MKTLAERWARERPDSPALSFGERSWSWSELHREVGQLARALRGAGLGLDSRIGVLAANAPETVLLVHAAARVGASLVMLNTRLTALELAGQLARSRCEVVIAGDAERAKLTALALPLMGFAELAAIDGPELPSLAARQRVLTLMFTSGTTGQPRAAALTLGNHLASARASALGLGSSPGELHLANLPLFHVGGLAMIFRALESGGALRLHERFDPEAVLRELRERPVTHLSLVATTLARLLEANGSGPLTHHLRILLLGGGPLPGPLRARAEALGLTPLHTYGLTETASQVVTVRPEDLSCAGGSAGRALPGNEVRVVDPERRIVPAGTAGEIELRGPSVMCGYDGDPLATAAALPDGWLRTRDLGTLDERGFLTVHARRSDSILSGGENVYPAELEAILLGAPGVREAAVLGRDDAEWGQVPIAALVLEAGGSKAAVEAHLTQHLARYKRPRALVALAELPHTASGKVDRTRLRSLIDDALS